ncbi:MAG: hypothetical protein ACXABF_13010 [Candidatus Thorarchaeota archaeon]|jgi:hypothetical protein
MKYSPRYDSTGKWLLVGRYWVRLSDGFRLPVVQGEGKAVGNQQAFRFRNDDGDETGASWMSPGNNVNQTIQVGANNRFRVRFVVEETAAGTLNLLGRLHYSLDGGVYTTLTTGSSYIRAIDSNNTSWTITDGDSTTRQIYTGTYVTGTFSNDGDCENATIDNSFTELEYCLYVFDATGSSTIDLRVYDSAAELDNYNQTPRITVQEAAAPQSIQLNTLELSSNHQSLGAVTPGAASIATDTLEIQSRIGSVDVLTPETIALDTLELVSNIPDITVSQPLTVALNTLKVVAERPFPNLHSIDFETQDFSEFDSLTDPDNDLFVSQENSMFGNWGMGVIIDDDTPVYGTKNILISSTEIRYGFYADYNGLTTPTDNEFIICSLNGPSGTVQEVYFNQFSGQMRIVSRTYHDIGGSAISIDAITDEPHYFETRIIRETSDGAGDGIATIWIDGVQTFQTVDRANFIRFNAIDNISMGAYTAPETGTSGTLYFDKLSVSDDPSLEFVPSFVTVSPSAVSVQLNTLELQAQTDPITVSPEAASTSLDTLELTSAVGDVTPSVGAAIIALDTLKLIAERPFPNLFDIDFETGDISEFDSTSGSANLSVTEDASMFGRYGMESLIDDTNPFWGGKDLSTPSSEIRYGFRINPNGIIIPDGDNFIIASIYRNPDGFSSTLAQANLNYTTTGGYTIVGFLVEDDSTFRETEFVSIPANGVSRVEFRLQRASSDAASDGRLDILVDGVIRTPATGYDNYDIFSNIDDARFGARAGIDVGTTGTYYLDKLIASDGESLDFAPSLITVSPGAVTIPLNTLELSANTPDVGISIGAADATISLNTLELSASPQRLDVLFEVLILTRRPVGRRFPYQPKIIGGREVAAAPIPPLSVSLDTLALTTNIGDVTISAGAISQLLDTLELVSNIIDVTVSPGVASTLLDTLILQSSVEDLSVIAGAASILLDTLELESNIQSLTVSPAAVSQLLDTLILRSNVEDLSVAIGAISILLDSLELSSNLQSLTVSPGAASQLLDTLILNSSAEDISVVAGVASILLDTLILQSSAEDIVISPGAVSQLLDTLILNAQIENVTVSPSAVSTSLDTLELTSFAVDLSITIGATSILLDSLQVQSNIQDVTVSPGAVSIQLDELILTSQIPDLTVVGVGALTVLLNEVILQANTDSITVSPGAVSIALDELILNANTGNIDVLIGAVSILLDSLQITSEIGDVTVVPGAVSIQLNTLELEALAVALGVSPGSVSTLLDTLELRSSAEQLNIAIGAATVLLQSLLGQFNAPDATVVPGATSIALDTLELTSYVDDLFVFTTTPTVALDTLELRSQVVDLVIAPAAVSLPMDTLILNSQIIDVTLAIVQAFVAGGVTISDKLISDILLSEELISDVTISDFGIGDVVISDGDHA